MFPFRINPKNTLPAKVSSNCHIRGVFGGISGMVSPAGFEPTAFGLGMASF